MYFSLQPINLISWCFCDGGNNALLVLDVGCDVFLPNVNQNSSAGDIVCTKACSVFEDKMTRSAVYYYCLLLFRILPSVTSALFFSPSCLLLVRSVFRAGWEDLHKTIKSQNMSIFNCCSRLFFSSFRALSVHQSVSPKPCGTFLKLCTHG